MRCSRIGCIKYSDINKKLILFIIVYSYFLNFLVFKYSIPSQIYLCPTSCCYHFIRKIVTKIQA